MVGLSKLDIYWWYFHTFRDCSELGLHLHGRILSSTLSIFEDLQIFNKIFWLLKKKGKDQALVKLKNLNQITS